MLDDLPARDLSACAAGAVADPSVESDAGMRDLRRRADLWLAQADAGPAGAKTRTVLHWLLAHPEESAVRTITELAEATRVNPSTLTRLVRRLGYAGFAAFQDVFRNAMAQQHRRFYSDQVNRLVHEVEAVARPCGLRAADEMPLSAMPQDPGIAMLWNAQVQARDNLLVFLQQSDPRMLHEIVRTLGRAPRVRVHGLRQFSALACFLAYGLGLIRPDVGLLDPHGLGAAEGLAQLRPGDVVLVASVSPYTRSVAQAARVARDAGLTVIAVTDGPASPLAQAATYSLCIPHGGDFFSNSMGAYMVLSEGLLSLVARDLGQAAVQAIQHRETLLSSLDVEQA